MKLKDDFELIYREQMAVPTDNNEMFELNGGQYAIRQTKLAYETFMSTLKYASYHAHILRDIDPEKKKSKRRPKMSTKPHIQSEPIQRPQAPTNEAQADTESPFYRSRYGLTFVDLLDLFVEQGKPLTKKWLIKRFGVSNYVVNCLLTDAVDFGFKAVLNLTDGIDPINLSFIAESGALEDWRKAVASKIKPNHLSEYAAVELS